MKLFTYLQSQSSTSLMYLGIFLVIALSVIDLFSGHELSISVFYLIPISMVAWFGGRTAGLVTSVFCSVSWLGADLLSYHVYSNTLIPLWNALMRLGVFAVVSLILSTLRTSKDNLEELMHLIVHDLRTPLTNVMNGLFLLREDSAKSKPGTSELLDTCMISCSSMMTLINSMLDLHKLELGALKLNLQQLSIQEIVSNAVSDVTIWAARNRITLEVLSENDAPSKVYADAGLFTRVLVNLLSNAIRFSASNATVTVKIKNHDEHYLALQIIDCGSGIPPDMVDKVFQKFYQAVDRSGSKRSGSGIGLAFCRLAVELQGGRIWLESELDKGTKVTVTVPLAR